MDNKTFYRALDAISKKAGRLGEPRCCICKGEHGLVWDWDGYEDNWVHLHCAIDSKKKEEEF